MIISDILIAFKIGVLSVMKNKHMSQYDRITIENGLNHSLSFKAIAKKIGKDCTTVSKEIRNNFNVKEIAGYGRVFNNCAKRLECSFFNSVCQPCSHHSQTKKCSLCKYNCRSHCKEFVEEKCSMLDKPPYVCNACTNRSKCTLTKHIYYALQADKKYNARLTESRTGICINEAEIKYLNDLLVPLIREKGQSIHHVYIIHQDEIMMSEKTLYKIIDQGILEVRNIDLPRKVRYRQRKKKSSSYKIDKNCLEGRRYEDFLNFMNEHPDTAVVEMDSVEGIKGESCLLTVHFTVCSFMIAVKRHFNDSKSVTDFFNDIYDKLGNDLFVKLFPVILTDNGSEFSNPEAIEFDKDGRRRTYIFYCHPSSPFEKGACEVNHELLRRIVPKGVTWNQYTQKDINIMMSHINSYARDKLNDKSPFLLFSCLYGEEVPNFFNITCIEPDDINLTKGLISK